MSCRSRWSETGLVLLTVLVLVRTGAACELPPAPDAPKGRILYRLDAGKSLVRFDAEAFLHHFEGKTSNIQGTIRLADLERLTDAEACIRIDAASLETGNGTRDGTMRREHLETAKFPTIDFVLTQVEGMHRQLDTWKFTARGILSLHGVSREILLPVRAWMVGDGLRLAGAIPLRMTDYGIPIPTFLFLAVKDQVVVSFDVAATRSS